MFEVFVDGGSMGGGSGGVDGSGRWTPARVGVNFELEGGDQRFGQYLFGFGGGRVVFWNCGIGCSGSSGGSMVWFAVAVVGVLH